MTEPGESGTAPEAARPKLPEPSLDDVWNALGDNVNLRLALSTLEANVPRPLDNRRHRPGAEGAVGQARRGGAVPDPALGSARVPAHQAAARRRCPGARHEGRRA